MISPLRSQFQNEREWFDANFAVTAGAGFIGSHVADHLLSLGHKVVALDDRSGGFIDHVPTGATFVNGSVLDEQLVERLFAKNEFSYVYHLAAYAAEGLSHFY